MIGCHSCGLLFLHSRRPDAAQSAPGDLPASCAPKNTIVRSKRGAASALMAALDRYFPASRPANGARILEFGCGTGTWLNSFQDRGWITYGIDPWCDVAFARHNRLTAVPVKPQFDLVFLYHVLEHLSRPLDSLRKLREALRPEGYFLISVPRLDTLAVHRRVQYCLRPRTHVVAFTETCLRGLLARAGLETVAVLHELDQAFTHGEPYRLRVLARKVDFPVLPPSDPAAALKPVLEIVSSVAASAQHDQLTPADAPEPASCPACQGQHVHVVEQWRLSAKRARAMTCTACGLLFVHPQPAKEELDDYYAPEGGWQASRGKGPSSVALSPDKPTAAHTDTKSGAPAVLAALDKHFPASQPRPGARVFDFGCGPGVWLNSFQDRGWGTFGLEPSTAAAFVRHQRLVTIPQTPQFDLIVVYHVLEHLRRPLETLCELAGALLPGGYLLVSVPRLDTLAIHHQVDYCLHPRHHIVGFTETCLRGLLGRAGLEVVDALHGLDDVLSKGMPTRLRLLARKTSTRPADLDPSSGRQPVIDALAGLNRRPA